MQTYIVQLIDNTTVEVEAESVTYDNIGNLVFFNHEKLQNVAGQKGVRLVRCIHNNHYVQYYPKSTIN